MHQTISIVINLKNEIASIYLLLWNTYNRREPKRGKEKKKENWNIGYKHFCWFFLFFPFLFYIKQIFGSKINRYAQCLCWAEEKLNNMYWIFSIVFAFLCTHSSFYYSFSSFCFFFIVFSYLINENEKSHSIFFHADFVQNFSQPTTDSVYLFFLFLLFFLIRDLAICINFNMCVHECVESKFLGIMNEWERKNEN